MDEQLPDYREALADGDPPLGGKIALAKERIEALDRKLSEIARAQAELTERVGRGELVEHEIERQEAELKKLRLETDRKRRTMAAYLAQLERASRS